MTLEMEPLEMAMKRLAPSGWVAGKSYDPEADAVLMQEDRAEAVKRAERRSNASFFSCERRTDKGARSGADRWMSWGGVGHGGLQRRFGRVLVDQERDFFVACGVSPMFVLMSVNWSIDAAADTGRAA